MRFMGLDIGTDRVGVAISDETGTIAQPFAVIETDGREQTTIDKVLELIKTNQIETVVVGLPVSLSGEPSGKSAMMAKRAGEKIKKAAGIPLIFWDERFTTAQAERALISAGVRRKQRRRVVDKIAASLILQSCLDAKSGGPSQ